MYLAELRKDLIKHQTWVSKRQTELLKKMGISTVEDLLSYFPFRYEDRSKVESIRVSITEKRPVTIIATVTDHQSIYFNRRKHPKIVIQDEETQAFLIGFNRFYLPKSLQIGKKYWISAQFVYKYNEIQASGFDFEEYQGTPENSEHFGNILPVYQTTEKLTVKETRKIARKALKNYLSLLDEELPSYLRDQHHLMGKQEALENMHFPENERSLKNAKLRFAFEEFFSIQMAVNIKRMQIEKYRKPQKYLNDAFFQRFTKVIPFTLTGAQLKSIREIKEDMKTETPMHRLLQGDVGSGKTSVAIASILFTVENGYQAAFMAPTEVLAAQHYRKIEAILKHFSIQCALLTGSTDNKKRAEILSKLENGHLPVVVGTHALIQEGVEFNELCLIIIDEQHKFGVEQRVSLSRKAEHPDLLVMTATPIPRTLTLSLYGDLDISLIDEMPAERKPIITEWLYKSQFNKLLDFVDKEVRQGRQAFFIYPLIEQSEKITAESAVETYERLKKHYPALSIGLVHGKLPSEQKEIIMQDFKTDSIQILVSTTVIEVGIDVPNATVMVIENADRFGLSNLHQLRGRVGRGKEQSYCFLVTETEVTDDTRFRMETLCKNNDGFVIAEEDLKLRGPGEILGYRQSGLPELRIADFIRDEKLLLVAKQDSISILKSDPDLNAEKNRSISDGIVKFLPTEFLQSG